MARYMLTTSDNPYNPFTHFDEWFMFDESSGYHTCAYLARVLKTSDELPEEQIDLDVERAIDEIVAVNVPGFYKKVDEDFNLEIIGNEPR